MVAETKTEAAEAKVEVEAVTKATMAAQARPAHTPMLRTRSYAGIAIRPATFHTIAQLRVATTTSKTAQTKSDNSLDVAVIV